MNFRRRIGYSSGSVEGKPIAVGADELEPRDGGSEPDSAAARFPSPQIGGSYRRIGYVSDGL